jgi:predicted DCC family thiol-disulfide oxidoreductase YuxK
MYTIHYITTASTVMLLLERTIETAKQTVDSEQWGITSESRPLGTADLQHMNTTPAVEYDVEVFHDGDCPLCQREIAMLRRWDKQQRIRFTDIAAEDFNPAEYGKTHDEFMVEIRGRLPDGTWIVGVEVFRRLYTAVGLGWLVAPTRWFGIRQLLDWGYRVFAKNRLRLTGRCTDRCAVPSKKP